MTTASSGRPDAYFLADHPALDFLNTVASPRGETIDWLENGDDLVTWLATARLIDEAVAARFRADADPFRTLDAVAEQARQLRQWLRSFVERHAGSPLPASATEELSSLNRLLAEDGTFRQLVAAPDGPAGRVVWQRDRRWTAPNQLLLPLADAIGDLVVEADFRLVRACEGAGCTMLFYDRTKAHARRWCSMALCGNRAKAAAHRERLRRERH